MLDILVNLLGGSSLLQGDLSMLTVSRDIEIGSAAAIRRYEHCTW